MDVQKTADIDGLSGRFLRDGLQVLSEPIVPCAIFLSKFLSLVRLQS